MINKFFDLKYYEMITKNYPLYPTSTINRLDEYLEQYPNDYMAIYLKAKLYLILEEYDKAIEILNDTNQIVYSKFATDKKREMILSMSNAYIKLKLDISRGDWEQALKDYNFYYALAKKTNHDFKTSSANNLSNFIKYHLGEQNESYNYYTSQLINYSYEALIDHLKQNHQSSFSDATSKFYQYENIKILFDEIQARLKDAKKYYIELSDEECFFKIDSIGYNQGVNANFIQVCLIYGTDKIITAFPVTDIGEYEYIDINYMKDMVENINQSKRNTESRIDKFYKRLEKSNRS